MCKYELIVRKKVSQFIEKEFRFFGIDFNHDDYKKMVYGEIGTQTPLDEKLKSFYDAFLYLLNSAKCPLTKQIIKKFYYLLFEKDINEHILLCIQSKLVELCEYSPIEKACEFHIYVYEKLDYLPDLDRQLVSLMFFNYVLVKNDIPAIKLVGRDIGAYVKKRDVYKTNREDLFLFFKNLVEKSFVLEKSYLKKLKPITANDIYKAINKMSKTLREKYNVEDLFLYGSFAKETNRCDSDIDLLVRLSLDLTYEQRLERIDELKALFFNTFTRFTDIEEVREFFDDDFIREATKIKRIL